jgi:hypothetical protein
MMTSKSLIKTVTLFMLLFSQVEEAVMNSLGRYLSLNIIIAPTR